MFIKELHSLGAAIRGDILHAVDDSGNSANYTLAPAASIFKPGSALTAITLPAPQVGKYIKFLHSYADPSATAQEITITAPYTFTLTCSSGQLANPVNLSKIEQLLCVSASEWHAIGDFNSTLLKTYIVATTDLDETTYQYTIPGDATRLIIDTIPAGGFVLPSNAAAGAVIEITTIAGNLPNFVITGAPGDVIIYRGSSYESGAPLPFNLSELGAIEKIAPGKWAVSTSAAAYNTENKTVYIDQGAEAVYFDIDAETIYLPFLTKNKEIILNTPLPQTNNKVKLISPEQINIITDLGIFTSMPIIAEPPLTLPLWEVTLPNAENITPLKYYNSNTWATGSFSGPTLPTKQILSVSSSDPIDASPIINEVHVYAPVLTLQLPETPTNGYALNLTAKEGSENFVLTSTAPFSIYFRGIVFNSAPNSNQLDILAALGVTTAEITKLSYVVDEHTPNGSWRINDSGTQPLCIPSDTLNNGTLIIGPGVGNISPPTNGTTVLNKFKLPAPYLGLSINFSLIANNQGTGGITLFSDEPTYVRYANRIIDLDGGELGRHFPGTISTLQVELMGETLIWNMNNATAAISATDTISGTDYTFADNINTLLFGDPLLNSNFTITLPTLRPGKYISFKTSSGGAANFNSNFTFIMPGQSKILTFVNGDYILNSDPQTIEINKGSFYIMYYEYNDEPCWVISETPLPEYGGLMIDHRDDADPTILDLNTERLDIVVIHTMPQNIQIGLGYNKTLVFDHLDNDPYALNLYIFNGSHPDTHLLLSNNEFIYLGTDTYTVKLPYIINMIDNYYDAKWIYCFNKSELNYIQPHNILITDSKSIYKFTEYTYSLYNINNQPTKLLFSSFPRSGNIFIALDEFKIKFGEDNIEGNDADNEGYYSFLHSNGDRFLFTRENGIITFNIIPPNLYDMTNDHSCGLANRLYLHSNKLQTIESNNFSGNAIIRYITPLLKNITFNAPVIWYKGRKYLNTCQIDCSDLKSITRINTNSNEVIYSINFERLEECVYNVTDFNGDIFQTNYPELAKNIADNIKSLPDPEISINSPNVPTYLYIFADIADEFTFQLYGNTKYLSNGQLRDDCTINSTHIILIPIQIVLSNGTKLTGWKYVSDGDNDIPGIDDLVFLGKTVSSINMYVDYTNLPAIMLPDANVTIPSYANNLYINMDLPGASNLPFLNFLSNTDHTYNISGHLINNVTFAYNGDVKINNNNNHLISKITVANGIFTATTEDDLNVNEDLLTLDVNTPGNLILSTIPNYIDIAKPFNAFKTFKITTGAGGSAPVTFVSQMEFTVVINNKYVMVFTGINNINPTYYYYINDIRKLLNFTINATTLQLNFDETTADVQGSYTMAVPQPVTTLTPQLQHLELNLNYPIATTGAFELDMSAQDMSAGYFNLIIRSPYIFSTINAKNDIYINSIFAEVGCQYFNSSYTASLTFIDKPSKIIINPFIFADFMPPVYIISGNYVINNILESSFTLNGVSYDSAAVLSPENNIYVVTGSDVQIKLNPADPIYTMYFMYSQPSVNITFSCDQGQSFIIYRNSETLTGGTASTSDKTYTLKNFTFAHLGGNSWQIIDDINNKSTVDVDTTTPAGSITNVPEIVQFMSRLPFNVQINSGSTFAAAKYLVMYSFSYYTDSQKDYSYNTDTKLLTIIDQPLTNDN